MIETLSRIIRALLPNAVSKPLFRSYHLLLAYLGALRYGFPSKDLVVIAVTGTKGKSTTVELIRAILEEAGYPVASANTIQFCITGNCEPNLFKMTMPGRFFLQKFLAEARRKGATHAVVEMTSEGAVQFRHKGIELNALVFTNLAPEHLASHGGMEAYAQAKLSLARHLAESPKRPRIIVANGDDVYGARFLEIDAEKRIPFSLKQIAPYTADDRGARFFFDGELLTSPLPGVFNLKNTLAAMTLCRELGVGNDAMKRAIEKTSRIAGRAERIERGQKFSVIVDYAHTPDSLRALFEAYKGAGTAEAGRRLICIIGSTGGGRDTWNRPVKGSIAEEFCDVSIIANEDPYDENPRKILEEIAKGFKTKQPHIVLDRRKAIALALKEAEEGDVVLITGKGTDPYIMGAKGTKEKWSDRKVAEEELDRRLKPAKRKRKTAARV